MTNPEVVFARFVAANPVPDPIALHSQGPDADDMVAMLNDTMPTALPLSSSGWPRRRSWLAAVAAFMVIVGLSAASIWIGDPSEPASTDPVEFVRHDAITKAEQWIVAVNAGEIEHVMSMSSPNSTSVADQRVHEWVAGFAAQGMPVQVQSCEVSTATSQDAIVECQVRLTDAVATHLGVAELTAPFRYSGGLLAWQPYMGADIGEVNDAYSTYLRLYHPTEYETVCAPAAYEAGSIVQDKGLALTGACAELAAPLADEIVLWIREGRPGP